MISVGKFSVLLHPSWKDDVAIKKNRGRCFIKLMSLTSIVAFLKADSIHKQVLIPNVLYTVRLNG